MDSPNQVSKYWYQTLHGLIPGPAANNSYCLPPPMGASPEEYNAEVLEQACTIVRKCSGSIFTWMCTASSSGGTGAGSRCAASASQSKPENQACVLT